MNENYPVFKQWISIVDWLMDRVETFPKSVRQTLSNRIINIALDIVEQIVEAIYSTQRAEIIDRINLSLEQLRVLIRIAHRRKYLSIKQYEHIALQINEVGKMLGGWKRSETIQSSL